MRLVITLLKLSGDVYRLLIARAIFNIHVNWNPQCINVEFGENFCHSQFLHPQAKLSHFKLLQPLGHWIAPSTMKWKYSLLDGNLHIQNVTHDISLGERCVSSFSCVLVYI